MLDNSDSYKCEKCCQISKAKIRHELSQLPSIVVFHLKRFIAFPQMKKIKGKCKYPDYVDMNQ
jgi:ubiquitin C-terminal hydrolase